MVFRIFLAMTGKIREERAFLAFLNRKLSLRTLENRIDNERYRINSFRDKICSSWRTRMQVERLRLRSFAGSFSVMGPERIMGSGFAYFTDLEGQPVVSAASLSPGKILKAHMRDGTADVAVRDIDLKERMI